MGTTKGSGQTLTDSIGRTAPFLKIRESEGCAIVSLRGEIDAYNGPQLRKGLRSVEAAGFRRVVLDLSGLRFVSSEGFGILVEASRALASRGGEAVISCPSSFCRFAIGLLRLDCVLPVFGTEREALRYLKRAR